MRHADLWCDVARARRGLGNEAEIRRAERVKAGAPTELHAERHRCDVRDVGYDRRRNPSERVDVVNIAQPRADLKEIPVGFDCGDDDGVELLIEQITLWA